MGYADGGKPLRERVPNGTVESGARPYAAARINELDHWLQGYVWGIVIRDHEGGEILESVWGFIGEPDSDWIRDEANGMAEGAAEAIERERKEVLRWACADVVTV